MRECYVLYIKIYFSVVGCVSVLFCISKYILVLLVRECSVLYIKVYFSVVGCVSVMFCSSVSKYILVLFGA